MGFMDRIRQQQTQRQPSLSDAMRMASGVGDPAQAICDMANRGATVTLPDGSYMPVSDLVRMANDKGIGHVLSMFGIDPGQSR